jgi:peroxiredoxin
VEGGSLEKGRKEMARRWISVLAILGLQLLLISLIPCSSLQSRSPGEEISSQISVGQKIPDLNLRDVQAALEYGWIQLYMLLPNASKTVLIFYRGYWSSDCQRQFADLRAHFSEFQEKGAQIIGVSADDPHRAAEFARKIEKEYRIGAKQFIEGELLKLPFRLVTDNAPRGVQTLGIGEEHPRYGLIARPTTILLDKQGTIHWLHIGKSAEDRPSADQILQLLASWS